MKPGPRGRSDGGNAEKTHGTRSKQWKPWVQVAMQIQHITGGWGDTSTGPSTCAFFSFSLLFFDGSIVDLQYHVYFRCVQGLLHDHALF